MKRRLPRVLCLLLALTVLASLFGCVNVPGLLRLDGGVSDGMHGAEATLPAPAPQRALVEDAQAMAVGSYLVARMYLEKLLQYDVAQGNKEEYDQLLADAVTAFETAEALAGTLETAVDMAQVAETFGADAYAGKAKYKSLASRNTFINGFILTAYAAEDPPAVKWAKEITAIYDSAPAMKGVRTLADQLGTDAKHAYAQLKQAQAILEGAAYDDFADYANKCYQTAVVLKAAGTTAGFVASIAVAGPATGLAAVAQTGGIVMGGVNSVLEIGQAGTIITTNGEGNEYTAALEKTEAQMAPIGQVFSVMSLGLNAHKLLTGGYGKDAVQAVADGKYTQYLDGVKNDVFGAASYLGTSVYDYVTSGSILSGTFTKTDKGTEFTLWDTLTGKEATEQKDGKEASAQDAVKEALEKAGVPAADVKTALETQNPTPTPLNEIPLSEAEKIIDSYPGIVPGSGFDATAYDQAMQEKCEEVVTKLLEEEAYTGELPDTHHETGGATFDFYDGTGALFDDANGIRVIWTHDENGDLTFVSSGDSEYTVDDDGNLLKDGEPVLFNGMPVNAFTGIGDPAPTEASEETEAPADVSVAELFDGEWRYVNELGANVVKTLTVVSEDTLLIEWQGKMVFGSDGITTISTTNKFTYDPATGVMTLREVSCNDPWQATTADYFTFTLKGDTITTYYYHALVALDDDGNGIYGDMAGGTYTRYYGD